MPSRRKSSNPCMVQVLGASDPEEALDVDVLDMEMSSDNPMDESEPCEASHQKAEGPDQAKFHPDTLEEKQSGEEDKQERESSSQSDLQAQERKSKDYECKCCPFWCPNLQDFKAHVDSSHPDVILNPMYHCAVCDFNTKKFELLTEHNKSLHPDENNFKFRRIKKNNQTILEQAVQFEGRPDPEEQSGSDASVFPPCLSTTVQSPDASEGLHGGGRVSVQKDPIAALNINGTVIIPEPAVLRDLSHVAPVLQRPPNYNCQPKIAVPLHSSKYNPTLDHNLTLITSFNKFPYPTHSELSWLTAASKHPEEQIKVWFTTQRLKQGITWSPEEVEEARKKMFNGSIPAAHHTFTAPSTSLASPTSAPAARPLQTAASSSGTLPFAADVPAGVAVGSGHAPKRCALMAHCGPESKRPVMAVAPSQGEPKEKGFLLPSQKENRPMAPPAGVTPFTTDMKKSPAVVPLMTSSSSSSSSSSPCTKGKLLPLSGNPKTKPVVSLPSIVFPESLTRPTIAPPPIFAPPFKSPLLLPRLPKDELPDTLPAANVTFPNSPSLVTPQLRRPPIIQSAHTPAKVPAGVPRPEPPSADEDGGLRGAATAFGDGTSGTSSKCPGDAPTPAHNNGLAQTEGGKLPLGDSQHKSSVPTQFPLLERMKGKTAAQLKILEEQFLRNSFLSHGDVDLLALATGLSHREIDGWFAERRALRDNLELALLNSMGTKRTELDRDATPPLNGIHKLSFGAEDRKSGSARSLPNCRWPAAAAALPKDHFAQSEGTSPSEVWPGLARVDLARWFCDGRSTLRADFFNNGGVAGLPDKRAPSGCQEVGAKVLEAELGWLAEQPANGLGAPQHGELQDRLAGRCE
ncbi:zinc fingers and homeoboxes protein 2-like [Festucalex cinctus]